MWALVGGVFAICLALFLYQSTDTFPETEQAFQQLLSPTQMVAFPFSPEDLPRVPAAQAALGRRGLSVTTVTARHVEELMSRRTLVAMYLKAKVFAQDEDKLFEDRSRELARCALALEALGERANAHIPVLATNFLDTPTSLRRTYTAGVLLAYVGTLGEQILLTGLTNSEARIRAAAVDGLRHRLFRQATAPGRSLPVEVAPQAWSAVTTGQGLFDSWPRHRSDHWEGWARQSAWMFSTNGVWLWALRLQEFRAPTKLTSDWELRELLAVLRTNQVGGATLRSNFVNLCIELAHDASPTNYGRGLFGLTEMGLREPRVVTALEGALSHSDPKVRTFVARELQKLKRPEESR